MAKAAAGRRSLIENAKAVFYFGAARVVSKFGLPVLAVFLAGLSMTPAPGAALGQVTLGQVTSELVLPGLRANARSDRALMRAIA